MTGPDRTDLDHGVAWADLRTATLVGTEKRPLPGATGADGESPEHAALRAAALLGAQRRAGLRPLRHDVSTTPITEIGTPERQASATAVQLLDLLLAGQTGNRATTDALLGQWLELAHLHHTIVPAHGLVRILTAGTRSVELRPAINGALGSRGRWLAAQNDDWAWAAIPTADIADPAIFRSLERVTRLAVFDRLRRTDPGASRRLFLEVVDDLDATNRHQLLQHFATNLGPADEPILDAGLDDRSTNVRWEAIRLLEQLPDAARSRRLTALVAPHVSRAGRLRPKITVDVDAIADHIGADDRDLPPTPDGVDPRAQRTIIALCAIPLDWWTRTLDSSPRRLLALDLEPRAILIYAWVRATIAQANRDWAVDLLDHGADQLPGEHARDRADVERRLLAVAGDDAASFVKDWLAGTSTWQAKLVALQQFPRPWSPAVARAVFATAGRDPQPLARAIAAFGPADLPASAQSDLDALAGRLQADAKNVASGLRSMSRHLAVRRSITDAFRIPPNVANCP